MGGDGGNAAREDHVAERCTDEQEEYDDSGAHADRPTYRYRICVRGRLGETLRSAFPALQAQASGGDTVLTGPLPDHAALYGVLAQIEALGLELLELRQIRPRPTSAEAGGDRPRPSG